MPLRPALTPLALALALVPAAAASAAESTWQLQYRGTATRDFTVENANDPQRYLRAQDHGDFSWEADINDVVFQDGRLATPRTGATTAAGKAWSILDATQDGSTERVLDCAGEGLEPWYEQHGYLVPELTAQTDIAGPDAQEVLVLTPFRNLAVKAPCAGGKAAEYVLPHPTPYAGYPRDRWPTAVFFTMPEEALKLGKVITLVESFPGRANSWCTGDGILNCQLTWKGEVTLTRKEYAPPPTPDDDILNPLPPALPEAPLPPSVLEPLTRDAPVAPTAPPAPVAPSGPAQAPKAASVGSASVAASAARASVAVRCAGACSGSVAAYAASPAAPRAAAAAKPLATRAFRSRGGRTTVTVRLGARARRAVKRAGGLRLVTTIKGTAGRVTIDRRTVRLHQR